jgi:hypothetical protein
MPILPAISDWANSAREVRERCQADFIAFHQPSKRNPLDFAKFQHFFGEEQGQKEDQPT